jgi:hypothetical protein
MGEERNSIYCDGAYCDNSFTQNKGGWGAVIKYQNNFNHSDQLCDSIVFYFGHSLVVA